jgi:predicted membrane-bound spermidine synthase
MRQTENALISALSALFLLSGACALVYQVAWQRILFAAFGADLESITIIVSAFMLGLGTGALAGGALADRWPKHALALFALAEGGIGLFALGSPALFRWVGEATVTASLSVIAAVNFALVLVPTLLMGASLPILVTDVSRRWRNIGRSTGQLYAVNTLGAALGALLAGFVLFYWLTLDEAIRLAALGNFIVALATLALVKAAEGARTCN